MKNKCTITLVSALCAALCVGCSSTSRPGGLEHEPLTILTAKMDYSPFETALHEEYPEIQLEFISYTGDNATEYNQYLLEHDEIPDIYSAFVFSDPQKQKENLIDLSGYEFVNSYMTAQINQVALEGAVYLLPANLGIIGLYYNQTLFAEHGWEVPRNFQELTALTLTIREAGIDPVAAQFELDGNGFFDLMTMAKTDFLTTPAGNQWEKDFLAGNASAAEGLTGAVQQLQELIDCGFLDATDTRRTSQETRELFYNRNAAMYLNAGTIARFTQNEDGSGDRYGILPFFGTDSGTMLVTLPMAYFGLSKSLQEPGCEQKMEDALKVMEFLATEKGQASLTATTADRESYIFSLKSSVFPKDSPLNEILVLIRDGCISTLAYAGYEDILTDIGSKVRDWVAGDCTGGEVLELMDQLQRDSLDDLRPPFAIVTEDLTLEETAQLQAEAFRLATGADIGLVSLGGYHDCVQNPSGVCGRLFAGEIPPELVNAIVPSRYNDPVFVLTLSGREFKTLLESGLILEGTDEGFPYIPAGIAFLKDKNSTVKEITMADGSSFDEAASYTVAVDRGGFTELIGKQGSAVETEIHVAMAVKDYLRANSPISPLEPSIR